MTEESTLALYQVAVTARFEGDRSYEIQRALRVYGTSDDHARVRAKRLAEAWDVTVLATEIVGRDVADYEDVEVR